MSAGPIAVLMRTTAINAMPVTTSGQRGEIGAVERVVPRRHARGFGMVGVLTTKLTPLSR